MATVEPIYNPSIVEIQQTTSLVEIQNNQPTVTTQTTNSIVEVQNTGVSVVTIGIQGAKGEDGTGGGTSEPPYRQYDSQPTNNLYFKGWSEDDDTSTATWKILKGVETSPDVFLELWASGDEELTKIWDDRASLTYS